MQTLEQLRHEIDQMDQELVSLVHKRLELVKKVGEYKKANHLPPLDATRWQAVLNSKMQLAQEMGVDPTLIKDLYERIHQTALELEAQV